jgi:RHS repeat-associated protein
VVVNVATGDVMLAVRYDVFGKPTKVEGIGSWDLDELPFGFAGGMFDQETGLVRFGARDYDPMTGRWTAKDPMRFDAGPANLYLYAFGDPVNLVDPTGLQTIGPGKPPEPTRRERAQDYLRRQGITEHSCIGGSVAAGLACMVGCATIFPEKTIGLALCLAACVGGAVGGGGYLCKDLDECDSEPELSPTSG